MCARFGLSWYELWASDKHPAIKARRKLGVAEMTFAEEACSLMGATAVCSLVFAAASGGALSMEATAALLGEADLLTEQNISVAAHAFGVSDTDLWALLASE